MYCNLQHNDNSFTPAVSLGGCESLVDHRHRWDPSQPPGLLRLSIGLESVQDLINDLADAFKKVTAAKTQ